MKFGLTRDSALWTLTAIIAAATYLSTLPPLNEWTYYQWLGTVSAAAMWVSGKLSNSNLKHSSEPRAKRGARV